MAHFIACHKNDDAIYSEDFFFQEIVRLHGIPRTIISYRDTKFLSYNWRSLWSIVGTKLLFGITCHPSTDGQMDVTNRTLTTLLRGMVSKCLRDWDVKLAHVEFACNRDASYATSHSPFEVCYGLNPLTPIDLIPIPKEFKVSFEAEAIAKEIKRTYKQVTA